MRTSRREPTTTGRARRRKCNLLFWYLILQLTAFSVTFFIRNEITILDSGNHPVALATEVEVLSDRAVVRDCYRLSREDCYRTAVYINGEWKRKGLHFRSVQSIESEIRLHIFAYRLGIGRDQAKDADIDLTEDRRILVRVAYKTLEVVGS